MSKMQQTAKYHRLQSWKNIITQCRASGLAASEYIRQNNISEGKYYYWLRLVREELVNQMPNVVPTSQESATTEKITFAPVPMPEVHAIAKDTEIHKQSLLLYCDRFKVEVTEDTSFNLLQMTLSALQAVNQ